MDDLSLRFPFHVQTALRQFGLVFPIGAVGNGIADDTVPLQAALDFAGAQPGLCGNIYLPPGRYRTTATLNIPNGVGIRGAGATRRYTYSAPNYTIFCASIIQPENNGVCLSGNYTEANPSQGGLFSDFGIECHGRGGSQIAVQLFSAWTQLWQNVTIANAGSIGLSLQSCIDSNFIGCRIFGCGGNGIDAYNTSVSGGINNCLFIGCASQANGGHGVALRRGCAYNIFHGGDYSSNTGSDFDLGSAAVSNATFVRYNRGDHYHTEANGVGTNLSAAANYCYNNYFRPLVSSVNHAPVAANSSNANMSRFVVGGQIDDEEGMVNILGGTTSTAVAFELPQPDTNFAILLSAPCAFPGFTVGSVTRVWADGITVNGFTVHSDVDPSPGRIQLAWRVVRRW